MTVHLEPQGPSALQDTQGNAANNSEGNSLWRSSGASEDIIPPKERIS